MNRWQYRWLQERDRRYSELRAVDQTAIDKAFAAKTEHDRLTNGILELLRVQSATFITKDEYERRHTDLIEKMDTVRAFTNNIQGRETLARGAILFVGAIAGIVGMWLSHIR